MPSLYLQRMGNLNARGMVLFTTVVATTIGLFGTPGKAAAVNSAITVSPNYTVATNVMGRMTTYTITVSGTVTLGSTDTWNGINVNFIEPGGTADSPTITYTVPAQGNTTPWSAVYTTPNGGKGWQAVATLFYSPGGKGPPIGTNANPNLMFNVPPP
jgi:hypothetical protein